MPARLFLLVAAIGLICGCASSDDHDNSAPDRRNSSPPTDPVTRPTTQMSSLTGTLRGGMMAIGGETTGWVLARDGGAGQVDLEVSAVREQAKRLDGERVTVLGRMIQRTYTERGVVPVMVVEKIIEAAPPL
ncbi:MAG TPA: hypothetical protein VGR35_18595 [Tepidisphaeraceae bacterium]|nr:hypothetical protein [Tepidisphaeraceae bacterium]